MQNSITNNITDYYQKDLLGNQSEYTTAQNRIEFNPDAPYEANEKLKEEYPHFSIVLF